MYIYKTGIIQGAYISYMWVHYVGKQRLK